MARKVFMVAASIWDWKWGGRGEGGQDSAQTTGLWQEVAEKLQAEAL